MRHADGDPRHVTACRPDARDSVRYRVCDG